MAIYRKCIRCRVNVKEGKIFQKEYDVRLGPNGDTSMGVGAGIGGGSRVIPIDIPLCMSSE